MILTHKNSKKDFSKKVGLFNKIPDLCLTCNKEFDKKNKEMVMTWNVVVNRQKEEVVFTVLVVVILIIV